MEPRTGTGEYAPQTPQPEQWVAPGAPERAPGGMPERQESRPAIEQPNEARRIEVQAQPPVAQGSLPAPQQQDDASSTQTVASDDSPLVAGDEDVIEKEWVDRAKKIINDTKDDPHQREQQIKSLQIDYLRKRYGREIGERPE